jgi:rare lipoprotein A
MKSRLLATVLFFIGDGLIAAGQRFGGRHPTGTITGKASWYGEGYRGKLMANGQRFDPDKFTCACWDYPLGTRLRVRNGLRWVIVEVTDRGPNLDLGRTIDLSCAAFAKLASLRLGVINVIIEPEPKEVRP